MRILYGLCGDGLGHTMRARVVAGYLRSRGHSVRMAARGRSAAILRSHGFDVLEVHGLSACYENGTLIRRKTLAKVLAGAPRRLGDNARTGIDEAIAFRPDVVLTDFSSFASAVAHAFDVPLVSLDHQHVLDRFVHPHAIVRHFAADFALARAAVSAKTPRCDRYLVSSFFFPVERAENRTPTSLFGPIVRAELTDSEATRGEHVLVYQTASGNPSLLPALAAVPDVEFRVYGTAGVAPADHVRLMPYGEQAFVRDLASARAVIANGGYTAISEALFFGKPILSIPVKNQPEQELNARWLDALGLGTFAPRICPNVVRRFLDRTDAYAPRKDRRLRAGTADAFFALERALQEVH